MSQQPKYFFAPTLLDAFCDFINAESIWSKYWGDADEPKISLADYEEQSYQAILDRINRVKGEPIEAAEKGTAWNDLVDTLLHNKQCGHTKFVRLGLDAIGNYVPTQSNEVVGIRCVTDNFTFDFDYQFALQAAMYFGKRVTVDGVEINTYPSDKCVSQVLVCANIETRYGVVELYGFIDEMRRDTIIDIKTTSHYEFGKYANYNQRFVYPYCIIESGMAEEVNFFEFTAYALKGGNSHTPLITGTQYSEVYNYNHEEATKRIKDTCERFIEFIEANRDKITDKNIFTKHSHNH